VHRGAAGPRKGLRRIVGDGYGGKLLGQTAAHVQRRWRWRYVGGDVNHIQRQCALYRGVAHRRRCDCGLRSCRWDRCRGHVDRGCRGWRGWRRRDWRERPRAAQAPRNGGIRRVRYVGRKRHRLGRVDRVSANVVGGNGDGDWKGNRSVATLRATASQRQTQQCHRQYTIFHHDWISLNRFFLNLATGNILPGNIGQKHACYRGTYPNYKSCPKANLLFKSASYNVPEFQVLCPRGKGFERRAVRSPIQAIATFGMRFLLRRPQRRSDTFCLTPETRHLTPDSSPTASKGACFAVSSSGRNSLTAIPRVPPEKPSMYAELMPTTSPRRFSTGPPLPPRAVGAS